MNKYKTDLINANKASEEKDKKIEDLEEQIKSLKAKLLEKNEDENKNDNINLEEKENNIDEQNKIDLLKEKKQIENLQENKQLNQEEEIKIKQEQQEINPINNYNNIETEKKLNQIESNIKKTNSNLNYDVNNNINIEINQSALLPKTNFNISSFDFEFCCFNKITFSFKETISFLY